MLLQQLKYLDFRQLELFLKVYQLGNFSLVARQENLSVTIITRSICQLETLLNQSLFYRNTRSVSPTEAGHMFALYAQRILGQLNLAYQDLSELSQEPRGSITLHSPVVFGQKHIAPHLAELMELYPKLQISLIQTDEDIDLAKLGVDIDFRINKLVNSSLKVKFFAEQEYYIVAAPSYIQKYGTPQTLEELMQHRCLCYKGKQGLYKWLMRAKDRYSSNKNNTKTGNNHSSNSSSSNLGITIDQKRLWQHITVFPALCSNNVETLIKACLDGAGIVLFPYWLIGTYLASGELIPLMTDYEVGNETEKTYISAVYANTKYTPLNTRVVLDFFAQKFSTAFAAEA